MPCSTPLASGYVICRSRWTSSCEHGLPPGLALQDAVILRVTARNLGEPVDNWPFRPLSDQPVAARVQPEEPLRINNLRDCRIGASALCPNCAHPSLQRLRTFPSKCSSCCRLTRHGIG